MKELKGSFRLDRLKARRCSALLQFRLKVSSLVFSTYHKRFLQSLKLSSRLPHHFSPICSHANLTLTNGSLLLSFKHSSLVSFTLFCNNLLPQHFSIR
jgi:hypothetical protein